MNRLVMIFFTTALIVLTAIFTAYAVTATYEIEQSRQANYTLALMHSNAAQAAEIASLRAEIAEGIEIADQLTLVPLGGFEVTHYCYNSGLTASGTKVLEGRTVAVNKEQIPLGSLIYIENVGFRLAEDVGGGIERNELDLYVESKAECIKLGRVNRKIWIVRSD